jgi:hypothetical protein
MVPSNRVLGPSASFARRSELVDHIFVRFVLSVHTCLGALDREAEGVCDNDGCTGDVAEHKAHDFDFAAGAGVGSHLEEGEGGDAAVGEEGGLTFPRFGGVKWGLIWMQRPLQEAGAQPGGATDHFKPFLALTFCCWSTFSSSLRVVCLNNGL